MSPAGAGREVDSAKAPPLHQPARDNLVKRTLELTAGFPVDHPPRHQGVGAAGSRFLRRVDVHAAKQFGLVVIEHCVVERHVTGDLVLVAGQVLAVVLICHVGRWPPPHLTVSRPQSLA
jgi:hypothetical protein